MILEYVFVCLRVVHRDILVVQLGRVPRMPKASGAMYKFHTKLIDRRVKLLTIGDKKAGKTSILASLQSWQKKRICSDDDERTNKVEIARHSIAGLEWLYFDFPGHVEFYATNSLFLFSKSCITLLTVDLSNEKVWVTRLKYWLSVLNSYGEAKQQIDVIVVGTHRDQLKDAASTHRIFCQVPKTFRFTFPNVRICGCYEVNATDSNDASVNKLRNQLQSMGKCINARRKMAIAKYGRENLIYARNLLYYWSKGSKMMSWKIFVSQIRDRIDKNNATNIAVMLHEMGDVLRIGKQDDSRVVLDLPWLSAIIGVIVRPLTLGGIENVSDDGITYYKEVETVLTNASMPEVSAGDHKANLKPSRLVQPQRVPSVLVLLESLHVLYRFGASRKNSKGQPTKILIPARLKDNDVKFEYVSSRSSDNKNNTNNNPHIHFLGLRYAWEPNEFIPPGFLSCLICRVNVCLNLSRAHMPSARRSFLLEFEDYSLLVCLNRNGQCLDMVVASSTRTTAMRIIQTVEKLIVKELKHGRWGQSIPKWTVRVLCSGCCSLWKERDSWVSCMDWEEGALMISESKSPSRYKCRSLNCFMDTRFNLKNVVQVCLFSDIRDISVRFADTWMFLYDPSCCTRYQSAVPKQSRYLVTHQLSCGPTNT